MKRMSCGLFTAYTENKTNVLKSTQEKPATGQKNNRKRIYVPCLLTACPCGQTSVKANDKGPF